MSAKEKQATPKAAFVFLALLTSKHPAKCRQVCKADLEARKRGLASEYIIYDRIQLLRSWILSLLYQVKSNAHFVRA